MDDGCTSVPDEDAAIQLCKDVIGMLAKGGFHVHKFQSNSERVLESLNPEHRAKNVQDINLEDSTSLLPEDHALGLLWDPNRDVFKFRISLKETPVQCRKFEGNLAEASASRSCGGGSGSLLFIYLVI